MSVRRRVLRFLLRAVGLLLALSIAAALVIGWRAFGRRAVGARQARLEHCPEWRDAHVINPQPLHNDFGRSMKGLWHLDPNLTPKTPLPVVAMDVANLAVVPKSGLRVTWFGHSSTLVEIDGQRVLTDPIWSERAGPLPFLGPRRWFAPPIALAALPHIDAVVISHDHYDHLDYATIRAMKDWDTTFVVPLGVGAHLVYWGISETRIVELDWWESRRIGGLEIVCTPARHASGRLLIDNDKKLWAGYVLRSASHRVYYSGDTGLFPAMREIGQRLGPFDLTMIEVGQYGSGWPDWHIGPEQAVRAHQMVRGQLMLPVHWGAFALAAHAWTAPVERVLRAAEVAGVKLVIPRPGQSFEPAEAPSVERWWPKLPFRNSTDEPIVSSQID